LGKNERVLGGGFGVESQGDKLIAIYMLLQAHNNTDATTSAKRFIDLSQRLKETDDIEVQKFTKFYSKYDGENKWHL
jgi:hypothetical protein